MIKIKNKGIRDPNSIFENSKTPLSIVLSAMNVTITMKILRKTKKKLLFIISFLNIFLIMASDLNISPSQLQN